MLGIFVKFNILVATLGGRGLLVSPWNAFHIGDVHTQLAWRAEVIESWIFGFHAIFPIACVFQLRTEQWGDFREAGGYRF